jgi:hypothetical protein
MLRRLPLLFLVWIFTVNLHAETLAGVEIHGFATQGVLFSSENNYLTMQSSAGSAQWTDGAVSFLDSLTDNLRVGVQLHIYQLGQLGGGDLKIDWASADYRVNDRLGFRAGKVKTVMGLFNDSQDVDAIFLWTLLPQASYPIDNESFFLAHLGGDTYGYLPLGRRAGKLRYVGYVGYDELDLHGGYMKQLNDLGLRFTSSPGGATWGGDLRWETPWRGLIAGSSAMVDALHGTSPEGSMRVFSFLMTAQYAQFARGKFYFAGEYDRAPFNENVASAQEKVSLPMDMRCWYAMGSYRLTKKLHVGSYYSHYVNKAMETTMPANYSKDRVVSGRYDFNSYFYGKIEGHFLQGDGLGYYASTNPNGVKPNSSMLAAKFGFSF